MNKKKMCVVTTIPHSLIFFRGQLRFLSRMFEITAVSSEPEKLAEMGKQEGVAVHCIPMKRPISLWNDLKGLWLFVRYFQRVKPDIVHGNTPKGAFLSMLAARFVGVPVRIYMCHGLRYQGAHGFLKRLLMFMEKVTCRCATQVLCVSFGVCGQLEKDGVCKKGKSKVVLNGSANGIDLSYYIRKDEDREVWRKRLGIGDRDFVFSFVGRVVKDKGVNELVMAFNRLSGEIRGIHLVIVGSEESALDPISEESRDIIRKNDCIRTVGMQSDIRPYVTLSDAFVLPSYREGFGQVLMEAGALGVPCITTDITGCNEIIQNGINGRIIPPRDEQALYEAMKWFYEHRDDEVKIMAENARPMIAERYEQHKVWEALLKEYQSL